MEILHAIILGIVQGLTEFLPVSSSAHLILVPWFSGWEPEGIVFDVSLHMGTAVAVLVFFWKDWIRLAREVLLGFRQGDLSGNPSRRLFWFLVVGTLPAAILGLAFEETIETRLRSPLVTVITLAVFGALLFIAEKRSRQNRTLEEFGWADCLWVGLCQALSLIPGISRSGITITAALLRNATRTSAARFSFLLSTPVIVGAGMLKSWHLIGALLHPAAGISPMRWDVFSVGFLCAAVTGLLCIKYFLDYLRTKSFVPFVIYRFLLAGLVLVYYFRMP